MSTTIKQLAQAALAATGTSIYTAPSGVIVKEIVLCNTTAASKTVNIYFVPPAGSVAVSNAVLSAMPLAPNETKVISLSTVLASGATINASASVASVVGCTISGIEYA